MLGQDAFLLNDIVRRERSEHVYGPFYRFARDQPKWIFPALVVLSFALGVLLDPLPLIGLWFIVTMALLVTVTIRFVVWRRDPVNLERIEAGLRRLAALCARLPERPITDPVTGELLWSDHDDDGSQTLVVTGPGGLEQGTMVEYRIGTYGVGYRVFVRAGDEELPADAVSLQGRIGGTINDFLLARETEALASQVARALD